LGKVNPYATPEAPELRFAGDGDILLGFERMMHACAAIDCRELWIGTANFKGQYRGKWVYDRFRTDVSWEDQLAATEKFLHKLVPIARDLGIHLNLETHEEITTFECVRLVEAVGPDVMGITFDTTNVLQRAEDPVQAAKRISPYVRQSHVKDVAMSFTDDGVHWQQRRCGEGVVDFRSILSILFDSNPDLNLSIENPTARAPLFVIPAFDPLWLAAHPNLSVAEYAAWIRLIRQYDDRITRGDVETLQAVQGRPFTYADAVSYITESATHLRGLIAELRPSNGDSGRSST
jgi:sugar phosphate isomerase/epimerase